MEGEDDRWIPMRLRKQMKLEKLRSSLYEQVEEEEPVEEIEYSAGPKSNASLFDLKKDTDPNTKEMETQKRADEERMLLLSMTQETPLQSVANRAKGFVHTEPLKTTWIPPKAIVERPRDIVKRIRERFRISVGGEDIPPPIEKFEFFKFPKCIVRYLERKEITSPSPIQIQGLPVVLSGRDMIAVAQTGSGKTLVFSIPLLLFSLEEEMRLPAEPGEGPFCLILCPSRELAFQTYEIIMKLGFALERDRYPLLNTVLLIGGRRMKDQELKLKDGVHIIVATPGRLVHFLHEKKVSLAFCKHVCLDEADRLIDLGFEDEIRTILDHLNHQHQTILFSATMPATIQAFARSALVKPIEVNIGRAGTASLNVTQQIELVSPNSKMAYMLEALQKTPPPVLIFAENKGDVDDIHEYLLLKEIDAVSLHAGKDQKEREYAIQTFKTGKKDVLIATDVASKGLDFSGIEHVINFDMPKEIENYIHRIGRTGRGKKKGVATTLINRSCSPTILMDLKELLIESKQRIPLFLQELTGSDVDFEKELETSTGLKGCSYCGGLGHRIGSCLKAESTKLRQLKVSSGLASKTVFRNNYGEY